MLRVLPVQQGDVFGRSWIARSRLITVLLTGCAALALTGCAPDVGGLAVLDRTEQPSDALPANLQDFDTGEAVDLETARYIGEHHGTEVWFMRDRSGTGVCLLAYADEAVTASSCVTPIGKFMVDTSATDFYVVPDGDPGPDNATKVSENLYAKG